jgi:hypothetical protein
MGKGWLFVALAVLWLAAPEAAELRNVFPPFQQQFNLSQVFRRAVDQLACLENVAVFGARSRRSARTQVAAGVTALTLLEELDAFGKSMRALATAPRWAKHGLDAAKVVEENDLFVLRGRPSDVARRRWGTRAYRSSRKLDAVYPFAARVLVEEDSRVLLFGDLHGALHSLLRILMGLRSAGMLSDSLEIAPEWKGKLFLVFLGDYVDRGAYGVETVFLLLRLVRANTDPADGSSSVFLVRGNHEDADVNAQSGSFEEEVRHKYLSSELPPEWAPLARGVTASPRTSLASRVVLCAMSRFYGMLPQVIYLGTHGAPASMERVGSLHGMCGGINDTECAQEHPDGSGWYVQGCHGGLEVGFNPLSLLKQPELAAHETRTGTAVLLQPIVSFRRKTWLWTRGDHFRPNLTRGGWEKAFHDYVSADEHGSSNDMASFPVDEHGTSERSSGFLWSDFFVQDTDSLFAYRRGRGAVFGRRLTKHWLRDNGVAAVVRAHQHYDSSVVGDALSRMRERGGWTDHWQSDGSVTTFLSGGGIPQLEFEHDGVGMLHVRGTYPRDWVLLHCSHPINSENTTCDETFQLQCRALPWIGQHQTVDTRGVFQPQSRDGSSVVEGDMIDDSPIRPPLPTGTGSAEGAWRVQVLDPSPGSLVFASHHEGARYRSLTVTADVLPPSFDLAVAQEPLQVCLLLLRFSPKVSSFGLVPSTMTELGQSMTDSSWEMVGREHCRGFAVGERVQLRLVERNQAVPPKHHSKALVPFRARNDAFLAVVFLRSGRDSPWVAWGSSQFQVGNWE